MSELTCTQSQVNHAQTLHMTDQILSNWVTSDRLWHLTTRVDMSCQDCITQYQQPTSRVLKPWEGMTYSRRCHYLPQTFLFFKFHNVARFERSPTSMNKSLNQKWGIWTMKSDHWAKPFFPLLTGKTHANSNYCNQLVNLAYSQEEGVISSLYSSRKIYRYV